MILVTCVIPSISYREEQKKLERDLAQKAAPQSQVRARICKR
jgi:hypothetical protein